MGRALHLNLPDAQGQLLLWPVSGGYQAEVLLTPARSGTLTLSGALPQGAVLTSGAPSWSGAVQAGQTVRLNYVYRTDTSTEASLVQPLLEWKE